MELRARAYRLLVRRRDDPEFDFFHHDRPRVRSFAEAPVTDLCIALVTTAGLFHRRTSEPFVVVPGRGDPTFRELPVEASASDLSITPGQFETRAADVDLEVLYPLAALERAVEAGLAGRVCPVALSMHGHIAAPQRLLDETAPAAAATLRRRGARAVIIVGACALGSQSAGIAALAFEAEGLPTAVVTQWPEVAREAGAARAVASPFPFGMTMGPPKVAAAHDWLLRRALGSLSPRQG